MPTKEEFTFLSKNGKTQIHAVRWLPDTTEYRAVLQITHGMIEYIDRYDAFASYLASLGFLVVGHDHLGHGASVETEKDWGYFADQPSDTVIADMNTLRTLTAKEHPGLPYFMLAHSMGSYMLRKYLSIYGTGLAGAVIMGTGYIPDSQVKIAIRAVTASAKIHGWDYHSDLVRKLTFGKPYHRYDLTGADAGNSWLTKDEKIVKAYYSDPRCTFTFSNNAYLGLFEAVYFDNRSENIAKIPKTLPLFLVSGKDDPVGNLGEGVQYVYKKYQEAGILDTSCKLYENDRHEILNETDKETVYRDIAFGPTNMGLSKDEIDRRVRESAHFAGLTDDLLEKSPFALSGGQKRRVAIAGVIAMEPEVLVLDEPSAGLDPQGREELLANIREFHRARGTTVVLVSHSMEEIAKNVDRIVVLSDSHVLMSGTPREVFARGDELMTAGLDVPQVTRVAMALRDKGIAINPAVYTVDELSKELVALKRGGGKKC